MAVTATQKTAHVKQHTNALTTQLSRTRYFISVCTSLNISDPLHQEYTYSYGTMIL